MESDLRSVWLTHFIIYISIRRFWYNHYSNHMIFFCESTIPTHLNWASNPESFGFIWRLWGSIFCLSEYIFWGHFEISICPDIAMGHIYGQGGGWLAGLATLVVTRAILCWTQDSHALIFRCHLFTSRKASGLVGKIFHILFLLRESVSLTQIFSSLWPKINWHHAWPSIWFTHSFKTRDVSKKQKHIWLFRFTCFSRWLALICTPSWDAVSRAAGVPTITALRTQLLSNWAEQSSSYGIVIEHMGS